MILVQVSNLTAI